MKYNYYYRIGNGETIKTTLQGLKNQLNKVCLKHEYINEWISIESTDLKKVDAVIRAIRKGQHYIFMRSDNKSLCCHATKGGDK